MDDRELADKVAALLKIEQITTWDAPYWFARERLTPHELVADWNVVGKLMERVSHPLTVKTVDSAAYVTITIYSPGGDEEAEPIRIVATHPNTARAIIEACVQALSTEESGQ